MSTLCARRSPKPMSLFHLRLSWVLQLVMLTHSRPHQSISTRSSCCSNYAHPTRGSSRHVQTVAMESVKEINSALKKLRCSQFRYMDETRSRRSAQYLRREMRLAFDWQPFSE